MAFYLKYRPQIIADLDIVDLRDTLYGLLMSSSLPHAILFTGIRGTGKTSSARILAKAINCTKNKRTKAKKTEDVEPCNQCDACKSITKGSAMDVIEIDAASHRGIDDIRDLREKVKLAPTQLDYKVYIIDEVHMLTTEAFNALLKTLEEPPRNVIFILATTELHKLPDTIVSRCALVELRNANDSEIAAALGRVVKGEKLKIDDEAIASIAHLGQGSFRDATKYLEEVSWMKPLITQESVEHHFHLKSSDRDTLLANLSQKDIQSSIQLIQSVAESGVDIQQFTNQLIESLHQIVIQHFTNQKTPKDWDATTISQIPQLIAQIDQLSRLYSQTHIPQLPLQLAIAQWCSSMAIIPDLIRDPQQQSSSQSNTSISSPSKLVSVQHAPIQSRSAAPPKPTRPTPPPPNIKFDGEITSEVWNAIMQQVKARNFSVAGLLRSTQPKGIQDNAIILEVFYSFHKDKLEDEKARQLIEACISEVTGQKYVLKCVLTDKQPAPKSPKLSNHQNPVQKRSVSSTDIPPPKPKPPIKADSNLEEINKAKAGKKVSASAPVATEEDEELVKFAEELFTNNT